MANLLDRASVVLTPTAYNNGEALCIKPDDGSGDFDFSRNSAATRVNAQGLVENVQILSSNLVQNGDFSEEGAEEVSNGNFSQEGSELVTNGGFATDTDWTKQTSWSISGGSANYDFLSDAKYIRQTLLNGGFVSGKTYKINFEITSGTAYMNVNSNGGGLISLNTYSVGSYSIYVTASASGSDLLIYGRNTSGTAFSIDNVSVREVGQDWNLGGEVTIGDNLAHFESNTNTYSYIRQDISTDGKVFSNAFSNGGIRVDVSVGTHYFVLEAINTTFFNFRTLSGTGGLVQIDNVSVKEYLGQEVVPDSGCGSWLFEPQSTNLFTYSEDFSQSVWNKTNCTIISNNSISPNGTQNADKLVENNIINSSFKQILNICFIYKWFKIHYIYFC